MNKSQLDKKFLYFEILKIVGISGMVAYLFYDSLIGFSCFAVLVPMMWKSDSIAFLEKKKRMIRFEFKDLSCSLVGNLHAGYSLENAFMESTKEHEKIYGEKSLLLPELIAICNGLQCNVSLTFLLQGLSKRLMVKEISDLAAVLIVAKQYGGNMIFLLHQFTENITKRYLMEKEVEKNMASKRYEGFIMLIVPFFIIFYMRLTNPAYMDVMYQSLFGRCVMTGALIGIGISYMWMNKILSINKREALDI